jgi:hypothetical protein
MGHFFLHEHIRISLARAQIHLAHLLLRARVACRGSGIGPLVVVVCLLSTRGPIRKLAHIHLLLTGSALLGVLSCLSFRTN